MDRRVMGEEAGAARLFHLDGLYGEAVELAEAARAYLRQGTGGSGCHDPAHALAAACETTRLVSRVGFAIAWLLARRAAQSGELTPEEALDERWRLGGREVCLAGAALDSETLPPALAALVERGARLYARIERLDRQLAGPSSTIASPRGRT